METTERPYIYLPLEPRLHDVLRHEAKPLSDGLLLDGESMLCKFIINRVEPTLFPPKLVGGGDTLKLYLPVSDGNRHTYTKYYLTLSPFHREQIQEEVKLFLKLRCWQWDVEARSMGYGEKQIVESFCSAYGMRQSEDRHEMVKKIMYRQRRNIREEIARHIATTRLGNQPRRSRSKPPRTPELQLFS